MSVLINGMEMPTTCRECPLEQPYDGYNCAITGKSYSWALSGRPSDCPLVPVPPHEDLISRNQIIDIGLHLMNIAKNDDIYNGVKWLLQYIIEAQTIIPAEEGKTEKDTGPWLCLSCRHYPPSSTDGKPCSQCNPSEVWHSCYDPVEEGEI